MEPNNALSLEIKAALSAHLGNYTVNGAVKAKAFWPVSSGTALVAEGLNATWKPDGVEAIFALYPSEWDGTPEFGTRASGYAHHELVLKAWQGSTFGAYLALMEAFPLLSTNVARRSRLTPGGGSYIETRTVFLPVSL